LNVIEPIINALNAHTTTSRNPVSLYCPFHPSSTHSNNILSLLQSMIAFTVHYATHPPNDSTPSPPALTHFNHLLLSALSRTAVQLALHGIFVEELAASTVYVLLFSIILLLGCFYFLFFFFFFRSFIIW
jgi:hypothetical protein